MPGEFKRRGIKVKPTATEAEAMEQAFGVLVTGARRTGAEFTDPDDDWVPIWLILTKLHGTLVSGNAHKHDMAEYVGRLARKFGAVALGHLHSSWMIVQEDMDRERFDEIHRYMRNGGSLEDVAEAREIVLVALYSAAATRQYHAAISRDGVHPPTLGGFDLVAETGGDGDDWRIEGAMVDPLVAALKRVG